jgi:aerobic carbon-monoxide dehydrogenase medium subunit
MYPARFEYHAPQSVDEALTVLERYGDEGKVLAGGQSLIPLMKLRFASPRALVDINRIGGLDSIQEDNGFLSIGALVRHKDCERSDALRGRFGVLGDAAPQISDPIVRNLGTVVGSLAHADPQGDWGSALLAAGAQLEVASSGGTRTIPLDELFQGPFTTSLQANEIATAVQIPDPGARAGGTYLKLERKVGDYATAGAAAQLTLAANGTIERCGLALTNVGTVPIHAVDAAKSLLGKKPDDKTLGDAARAAAAKADPSADRRGNEEYKREMARVLATRALKLAVQRAGGK